MSKRKTTPIHRKALDTANRALRALGELNQEDPYVFAALVELVWSYDRFPSKWSEQLALIRERTHALKVRAVNASIGAAL